MIGLLEARKIIANYHRELSDRGKFAVDIDTLAKKLTLSINKKRWEDPETYGELKLDKEKNNYICNIKNGISLTQRKFTIAHQMSHFILHRHLLEDGIVENSLLRNDKLNNDIEREANY